MNDRQEVVGRIAAQIDSLNPAHPTRVGIDGVDAAGKTTLADELAQWLREAGRTVIRASIDGFHNPSAVRRQRGPDSPEGYFLDSFNYSVLRTVLLDPLGPGGSRRFRRAVFDFRTDTQIDAPLEEAAVDSVLLFDGVFLLRADIWDCWDFSVFVHADFATTVKRAITRDVELFGSEGEVLRRYTERYVPGQKIYLSEVEPERLATLVVVNDDPSSPVIRQRAVQADEGSSIHLVGPGGAGKSTVGKALASRIDLPFVDLDMEFMARVGDISKQIDNEGYEAYAGKNVEAYLSIAEPGDPSVFALSSGFMTYPDVVHAEYGRIRSKIAKSQKTFVLLPSIDLEVCVRETVRRQLTRPFARSAEEEEAVIRERYSIYMEVPAVKIETLRSLDEVVESIVAALPPNIQRTPGASRAGAADSPIR